MIEQIPHLKVMSVIDVLCAIAVLIALAIDLCAGVVKSKQRGEVTTSDSYAHTTMKIITNEGAVIIMASIDMLICFSHLWDIVDIPVLNSVPVLTILITAWECFVQAVSVKESADKKAEKHAKKEMQELFNTIKDLKKILSKEG